MKTNRKSLLLFLILGACLSLFLVPPSLWAHEDHDDSLYNAGLPEESTGSPVYGPARVLDGGALDRISRGIGEGRISFKDSVLLKARLLFSPATLGADGNAALLGGAAGLGEPCLTSFFVDVHRIFTELSEEERSFLKTLSEDLRVVVTAREKAAGIAHALDYEREDLPDFGLDHTLETGRFLVHYSLKGTHAVDQAYADMVSLQMSNSYIAITKKFLPGSAEGGGKFHVYIVNDMTDAWGLTVGVTNYSANRFASYIKISGRIKTDGGTGWKSYLRGTCFHEYFHASQFAYNAYISNWWKEGTAVWAQSFYGGDWASVKDDLERAESVVNMPERPIWEDTLRKYSTVAMAYYFADRYGKDVFMKSFFETAQTNNDAVAVLGGLMAKRGSTFNEEFKYYLVALYMKTIKSIAKYSPSMAVKVGFTFFGFNGTVTDLYELGAVVFRLSLAPIYGRDPKRSLLFRYAPSAAGSVQAFTITDRSKIPVMTKEGMDKWNYIAGFGSSVGQVIGFYASLAYTGTDMTKKDFAYEYLSPYIKVTKVQTAPTTIYQGDTSATTYTYTLEGTMAGQLFPIDIKLTEKGPNTQDDASGEYEVPEGSGKTLTFTWFTDTNQQTGTYKFGADLMTPPASWKTQWGMPQVKSSGKWNVKVVKAPKAPRGSAGKTDRIRVR
jgi:hypothetical protein